jgi:proliferating cell nuclear antigen
MFFLAVELKNVNFWQKSVNAISNFISEGNFRFNDNGIQFRAIDPSQIVLVDYKCDKASFDKYDIEPTFVGVDLVELSKIMQRALPNDAMQLELTDSELLMKFEGELSRSFRLPLIDVSDEEINIPQHKFDAKVTLNARVLKEALKDAGLFGTSVVLRVKGNQFWVEARGSQGTLKTVANPSQGLSVQCNGEVISKYSLNFLQNMVKEAEPDQIISLELKSDAPLRLTYKIGNAEIQFHLAHMIL